MKTTLTGLAILAPFASAVAASLAEVSIAGENLWDAANRTHTHTYGDTRLVIQIPAHLRNIGGEDHEVARWGGANVPWSGTLAEFVYYYDRPLCRHVDWNDTNLPFHPISKSGTNQALRPFVLMAPPGPCSPVTWARRAQFIGAAALMVADDVCKCDDNRCIDQYSQANCRKVDEPVLVNDGTAGDISIPVWLVPKVVSENLKQTLVTENQPVLIEYDWGLPVNVTDKDVKAEDSKIVRYHLWTAAAHDPHMTPRNVEEIRKVVRAFKDSMVLVPKFRLFDGTHFNCPQFTDPSTSPCDHLCTNGGRYCASHQMDLSGHAVVRETLRRICIWKHYKQGEYWDYWVHHSSICKDPHLYPSEACINEGLHLANIKPDIINDCMSESGAVNSTDENSLLGTMLEEHKTSGVVQLPAIARAADLSILEYASAHSLFESVCYHFYWRATSSGSHWKDIPAICETCFSCTNLMGCLDAGKCVGLDYHSKDGSGDGGEETPKSHSGNGRKVRRRRRWRFFWFLVIVGIGGYGYYYYQQQQRGMYEGNGGGGLLGNYLQLSSNDAYE